MNLDGGTNQAGGKFNFKVKIVQTDLSSPGYFYGGESPLVYQNSSYISKLYFINNFSGGILAKDRIEDMPERYRRFVNFDNPSDAQILKNFKKDVLTLANREEVGQNVFYSRLSNPEIADEINTNKSNKSSQANQTNQQIIASSAGNLREAEYNTQHENLEIFDSLKTLEDFENFLEEFLSEASGGNYDENGEETEKYEEYEEEPDDEEIRDILQLNNYFNSDSYKMSKIEYDFNAPGNINLMDDGTLEIKYDESEMTGLKDSYIQFLFKPENKDIVTVRRKYYFDIWFTLEKGRRVSIEKRGNYSGTVATTHTKEFVNKMTLKGGEMRFVYINEYDGSPSEMISHSICAVPAENN